MTARVRRSKPRAKRLVTLTTDFGTQDSYVAEVKAVLLSRVPDVRLVDVTHHIPAFDVELGAFQLWRCHDRFPPGTFHLAVVDPGVGTSRRAVYVKTKRYQFVGPDNGVLLWAVRACEAVERAKAQVWSIPVAPELPPTFHGRDVFAPFLAALVLGKKPHAERTDVLEGRPMPLPRREGGRWVGEILAPDHYGNLVTSIPYDLVPRPSDGRIADRSPVLRPVRAYQEIPPGEVALLRGSHGFWEISCHNASAAERLGVKRGTEVWIAPS